MAASLVCNVCSVPGMFETAEDVNRIPCHVRRFADQSFTVWRCQHCGSLHSKEEVDLDLFYRHYPLQQHKMDMHARIGYRNRLRILQKHGCTKQSAILDYGCGTGLFVQFLREQGYLNVSGYDPYIEKFSDPRVLEHQYDVLVSYDVIEHVAEPRDLLAEWYELVAPSGILVVGTPNADGLSLAKGQERTVEFSQPYHRHILSEKALRQLAEDLELKQLDCSHRFYFDSLVPMVNTRFMWGYVEATGGMIDVFVEPPKFGVFLKRPRLLFDAFFGYFNPPNSNLLMTLRKPEIEAASHKRRAML